MIKDCKKPWRCYDQMGIQRKGGTYGISKESANKNESSRERNRKFAERFAHYPKYHAEIRQDWTIIDLAVWGVLKSVKYNPRAC